MGCSLFNVLADYGPFLYPEDESLLTLAKRTDMEPKALNRYVERTIRDLEETVQYHETLKAQHQEAIDRLNARILKIKNGEMIA